VANGATPANAHEILQRRREGSFPAPRPPAEQLSTTDVVFSWGTLAPSYAPSRERLRRAIAELRQYMDRAEIARPTWYVRDNVIANASVDAARFWNSWPFEPRTPEERLSHALERTNLLDNPQELADA
jgi:hypothetical protein